MLDSSEDGVYDYDYDETGQLTGVNLDDDGDEVFDDVEDYGYDGTGNRTTSTVGGTTSTYTAGVFNRLEKVEIGAGSQIYHVYGYDDGGNCVAQYLWKDAVAEGGDGDGVVDANELSDIVLYSWDHRNRLVAVDQYDDISALGAGDPNQTVEYGYDFLNRLVVRTIDEDGVGVDPAENEYFVYDGDDLARRATVEKLAQSPDGSAPFGPDPDVDLRNNVNNGDSHLYWSGVHEKVNNR